MILRKKINLIIIFIAVLIAQFSYGQKKSEKFEFQYENKTLRGLIETPINKQPTAIVIIIPGYGQTDFVQGNWYGELRDTFIEFGLAVCFWDKMGCGDSEGEFNADQPVTSSADEAIAAIEELKKRDSLRSLKIGLWGLSRAGWICPLIIEKHPIDFWISASGTDDHENFGYLLKSNLLIHGKSEKEASYLYESWMKGHKIFSTGGSYESYLQAIAPLQKDTLCQKLFGYTDEAEITEKSKKEYHFNRETYTSFGYFDEKSGLWTYIPNFDETLRNVNCPVLAIFGENDSQVNWRKTKTLYERTISNDRLTVKTFPQCNHSIQKCETCAYREDLQKYRWQVCDGYYETMSDWLKNIGIIP